MLEAAKKHIQQYFTNTKFAYHSLKHTMDVYEDVTRIAELEEVTPEDLELLQIAALFHDTGYAANPAIHEKLSVELATSFLSKKAYPAEKIEKVKQLILATQMLVTPNNKLESIIKDADLAHLGKAAFKETSGLLRLENENLGVDTHADKVSWIEHNIAFLEDHKWHSKGGKKLFNKKKKDNLTRQKEDLKSLKKAEAAQKPEKGVETMYRVALRNHNQLSKIADNKANIMLSITSIMLSLILSSLSSKIDTNARLLIPTIIIIVVNLITMFFSIMATRPKVSTSPYSREKFLANKVNILFFGNFYKMPLDEFEWGMKKLMDDRDLLYGSLAKDLYFLGAVLAKKYRYLQFAYAIFMGGLVIATIAFVWAFINTPSINAIQ